MTDKLLVTLLSLLLAGCTTVDDPWLADLPEAGALQQNREVAVHLARADLLAMNRAPIAVRQFSGHQGLKQEIVYINETTITGENMLLVEEVSTGKGGAAYAPSLAVLNAEMRQAMPGIRMQMSPTLGSNAYGAYGAALGSAENGSGCVYAWQQTDRQKVSGKAPLPPLKIRLRYCAPKTDPSSLLTLLSSLSLGPTMAPALASRGTFDGEPQIYTYSSPPKQATTADIGRQDDRKTVVTAIQPMATEEMPAIRSIAVPLPR